MFSVVRLFLMIALAAAMVLPTTAAASGGARLKDDGFVQAQNDGGRWRGRGGDRRDAPQLLPLEVVLGNVAARFPGHHLGVEGPALRDGRWIYRIKWLTPDGRVLIVFADAQTGQVLGSRG